MYILTVIKNIFLILDRKQRTSLIFLQVFFLISAFVQIVGVASIAPFIAIISNPEIIEKNTILSWAYSAFGFESKNQFIAMFAIASIGMIFLSNSISALSFWLLLRYSVSWGSELQTKLFDNFLHREYIFHKTSNYNKSIAFVAQETQRFVYMVLQQFLILISQLSVAFVILIGLLLLNPFIALASGALIGGSYLVTYIFIRKSLSRHGEVITQRNRNIQSLLSEAFIGVKDIKLNALEERYINTFKKANHRGLASMAYISLSGDLPRYVIETISFGAILILATVLLVTSDSIENIISVISIYALAGYKLLPTMQQVYKCISNISANGSIVAELNYEINRPIKKDFYATTVEPLTEVEVIELDNISYQYPKANEPALKNISLTFEKGRLNTIAGPSGSGKSTLADLMLGLLPSSTGSISVNGEALTETLMPRYQRSIGYVPQNIFILDDTVVANVAFGVAKENIDIARVNEVLTQANAMEFVERLPKGLDTSLGQDGKLLSGGQRQRIGIARALYRNNKVLILDEPTSALDIDSEYDLMLLLGRLKAQVLIIVISHRPSAIKLSDMIMLIERGGLEAAGTYEELKRSSDHFREMMEKVFIE